VGQIKKIVHITYIQWVDAVSVSSWDTPDNLHIDTCFAVGFLVKEDKECICLAAAVSEDQCNSVICIPKAWVKKRKVLKVK